MAALLSQDFNSDLVLNIPQHKFLSSRNKYRAYVAGYGAGKSFVGCCGIIEHLAKNPRIDAAYYAPTYSLVRDVFYPTIEEVASLYGFRAEVKVSNHEIGIFHGRKYFGMIRCRTMDKPQNIVGYKSGHAMIDELDVLPADKAKIAWRKIIARMRYKDPNVRNSVDVTTTPEGFRFTHDRFVKNPTESSVLIRASTYDNEKNLPSDYIQSLLDDYPPELISAYVKGEFVNLTSGSVYKSYDRKRHDSKETVQGREPLMIGLDFNVTKMAAVIYVSRKNGWHAVDEIKDGYDTPSVIDTIRDRYPDNPITVYPDSSGKNRTSKSASVSDISLLKQYFTVKARSINPRVRDRVLSVNSLFSKNRLFINQDKCPSTADCVEQQAYDKNGEPDKSSGFDHQNDAFSYPIAYEFPVKKPTIERDALRIAF